MRPAYSLLFAFWAALVQAGIPIVRRAVRTVNLEPNNNVFDSDPYLQYRPPFVRSLPIQILLTGIVLTLVVVLLIHLIFTAQYHWPLAPVNCVLQVSGVVTLLISLIATMHVVLSATLEESTRWPYMISYIAVNVPPSNLDEDTTSWSTAERATWLIMNATTSGLIQITHIQFLTLLYPSRLEGRLIFSLLGPLAVTAAIVQLLPINDNVHVNIVASGIRNVCNAALSLLFTVALFIWGLLVNRGQAWRTDGGTAAFGAAALLLALVSTALTFLYIPREEEYVWLPALMWAVVLWQNFLGWWWWVGAGSGSRVERSARERRQRSERDSSGRRSARNSRINLSDDEAVVSDASASAAFGAPRRTSERWRRETTERRRQTKERARTVWRGVERAFSASSVTPATDLTPSSNSTERKRRRRRPSIPNQASTTNLRSKDSTTSEDSNTSTQTLPEFLPVFVHKYYAALRQAHTAAARKQTAERVARIRERERERLRSERERSGSPAVGSPGAVSGWGLGSFAFRSHESNNQPGEAEGIEMRDRSHSLDRPRDIRSDEEFSTEFEEDVDAEEEGARGRTSNSAGSSGQRRSPSGSRTRGDPETVASQTSAILLISETPPDLHTASQSPNTGESGSRRNSVWWWGPLSRWRLRDSTVY